MSHPDRLPLGQQMLRGAGIWQAIIALPICLVLGAEAFEIVLYPWNMRLYYFFRDSVTATMAAGIIFAVYVQRKAVISPYQYLLFEAAKSVLATGLWLWLILDSAFGPWLDVCREHSYMPPCDVSSRVTRAALASIVLFVFYFPSLGYSYLSWKRASEKDDSAEGSPVGQEQPSETAPLLS